MQFKEDVPVENKAESSVVLQKKKDYLIISVGLRVYSTVKNDHTRVFLVIELL